MPLRAPEPPEESVAVLRDTLGALAQRGQFSARGLRKARPEQLTATAPHPVFVLGLDDGAKEGRLEAARPSGWRYLLEVDEAVVASAETGLQADQHSFSHINDGPFVQGTTEAMTVAEEAAEKLPHEVELRLLHVPALYLMSLWLEPVGRTEGGGALFVPIAPAPAGIEANRVYGGEEFLGRVRELAQAVPSLAPDDETGGA